MIRDLLLRIGDGVVDYHLLLDEQEIALNPLIGGRVAIRFTGENAASTAAASEQALQQRLLLAVLPAAGHQRLCQVKPTLCHYETCREPEWGDAHCMIPTYVYLAMSSDVKVGITRSLPGRWLDQGAVEAVPIARVPNRKMAGELEAYLTQYVADKTNWRRMLKGEVAAPTSWPSAAGCWS